MTKRLSKVQKAIANQMAVSQLDSSKLAGIPLESIWNRVLDERRPNGKAKFH